MAGEKYLKFQFHPVRLKEGIAPYFDIGTVQFQFHPVRLKAADNKYINP